MAKPRSANTSSEQVTSDSLSYTDNKMVHVVNSTFLLKWHDSSFRRKLFHTVCLYVAFTALVSLSKVAWSFVNRTKNEIKQKHI